MIATVITTSLDGIWVPWFTNKLKDRETEAINTKVVGYINLMTYAMIGIILIGPEVVKLLASKGYWEGISIIPPIVLSNFIIFAYTLYVNIEHFHKKTLVITINTLIAAATNLILNLIFIPMFGYVAAAYTTMVSYTISFVLHAIIAKKLEPELYTLKIFAPSLIHLTLATVVFYVCVDMWYVRIPVLVIYMILMLYKNRDLIKTFLRRKS
jgi:O-antigen/teichoic acid export membrane protein